MKTQLRAACLALILACVMPAANILVFEDLALGTSAIPGALTLSGQCGTCTTTNDTGVFITELTGGTIWDLVIFAENNSSHFGSVATELTAYLTGGGRIIGNTWVTGGLDTLLEGSATGGNATPLNNDGNPVFDGIAGDLAILNSLGWGTYATRYNPLGTAVGIGALGGLPFGIILGNDGRTFLNAPLSDTYADLAQGERLLANEINILLGTSEVPEPSTFALLGAGLAFVALRRKR